MLNQAVADDAKPDPADGAADRGPAAPPALRRRVLIVTDRFPGDVAGGAEISLSLLVDALDPAAFDVHIAALTEGIGVVTSETRGAATIHRIPHNTHVWPAPRWRHRRFARGRWRSRFFRLADVAYFLVRPGGRARWERLKSVALALRLRAARQSHWEPMPDQDMVDFGAARVALAQVIDTLNPDIIHADNFRSVLFAAAVRPAATPLVAMVRDHRFSCVHRDQKRNVAGFACQTCTFLCVTHHEPPAAGEIITALHHTRAHRQSVLARADAIVTTSTHLKTRVEQDIPTDYKSVRVVANPADDVAFVDQVQAGIERATPPEILIVGMVNGNKGQAYVPRLIAMLKAEGLGDFRFVLAGRGQLLTKILKEAADKDVTDHIITPGFLSRPAIYRAYARASVVAAPNIWPEPFGRAPLEAGLSARPVVAFANGGVTETVLHDKTGLLVDPGDWTGFADAIHKLLTDPEKAAQFGAAGRDRIVKTYTSVDAARGLSDVWRDVLGVGDEQNGADQTTKRSRIA